MKTLIKTFFISTEVLNGKTPFKVIFKFLYKKIQNVAIWLHQADIDLMQ